MHERRFPDVRLRRGAVLLVSFVLAASNAAADLPRPQPGTWAPTSLALLKHSEQRCGNLGIRISRYWQKLNGSPADQKQHIARYLVNRATADLAAAREALDIAQRFLPHARQETNSLVADVLVRLHSAETELCNTVAAPVDDLDQFKADIDDQAVRLKALTSDLGDLMEISDPQLREVIKPFMKPIEQAIQRAELENQRDLTPLQRPTRRVPDKQHEMEAWHQVYLHASIEAKIALGEYLAGRRNNDTERTVEACKNLQDVAMALLLDDDVFDVPDERVEMPLRATYSAMRQMANRCVVGDFRGVDEEFARVEGGITSLAQLLKRYALMP